jgi:hypothetical protein
VLSRDADATSCPSGEKATAVTVSERPSSVLRLAINPMDQSNLIDLIDE